MKALLLLLALPMTAGSASADMNPHIYCYVDFDPPGEVHRVDPAPYDYVAACFVAGCSNDSFKNISLALYVTPESAIYLGYDNLLPGPTVWGDYETGVTIGSQECVQGSPLVFAVAHIIYSGVPGDVMILDHPQWPRWVVDCSYEVDYYCLHSHGGIGKDPVPTGEMCGCPSPVECTSWGAVKSLFR